MSRIRRGLAWGVLAGVAAAEAAAIGVAVRGPFADGWHKDLAVGAAVIAAAAAVGWASGEAGRD